MQSASLRAAACAVVLFLVCGTSAANTLSDAYYVAYSNPDSFELAVNSEIGSNKDFFKNYYACSVLARATLKNMEQYGHAKYAACDENSVCHKWAKEVQAIENLRLKVGALDEYINARQAKKPLPYLQSQAGIWAEQMKASPVPIQQLPLFQGEIAMLRSISCP